MSAIRAAAAARKTYGGAAMLPPRICPSYMRDFFLCRRRLLAGGGQKVWRIRGSDTARGLTRANRGFVGKFCNHMEGHEKPLISIAAKRVR